MGCRLTHCFWWEHRPQPSTWSQESAWTRDTIKKLLTAARPQVAAQAIHISMAPSRYQRGQHAPWTSINMSSGCSTTQRYLNGLQWLHGPQTSTQTLAAVGLRTQIRLLLVLQAFTSTWPLAATWTVDTNMAFCDTTDYGNPPGFWREQGPRTSTWPLVAAQTVGIHINLRLQQALGQQTVDTNMASRASTDQRGLSRRFKPKETNRLPSQTSCLVSEQRWSCHWAVCVGTESAQAPGCCALCWNVPLSTTAFPL